MRQAAIVLHASLLMLAAAAACSVDVPDADEGEFACKSSDDCSAGFTCDRPSGQETGTCVPRNGSNQECVPGSGATTCGVGKTCDATGHCVTTTPAACTATSGCTGTEACVVSTSGGANTCAASCTAEGVSCTPKGGSSGGGRCTQVTKTGGGTALVCAACTSCSSGTCEARVLAAANLASATYCNKTTETCGTTSDDDADGLTNCDDRDCVGKPECSGGGTPGCTPACTSPAICVRDSASSNQGVCVDSCTGDVASCDQDRACAHVLGLPGDAATRGCVACAGTCSSMLDSTCVATSPTAAPVANASVDCVSMWAEVKSSGTGDGVSGLDGTLRSVGQVAGRFMHDLALTAAHQPIVVWSSGSPGSEEVYLTHFVAATTGDWRADPADTVNSSRIKNVSVSGTTASQHPSIATFTGIPGDPSFAIAWREGSMACATRARPQQATGWSNYSGACAAAFTNSEGVDFLDLASLTGHEYALVYQSGVAASARAQAMKLAADLGSQNMGLAINMASPVSPTDQGWPQIAGVLDSGTGAKGALMVWADDATEASPDVRFETFAKRNNSPLVVANGWTDVATPPNGMRSLLGADETRHGDVAVAPNATGLAHIAVESHKPSSSWDVTVLRTSVNATTTPTPLGTTTKFLAGSGEAEAPAIAMADDGSVVVAYQWRPNNTSNWRIMARAFNGTAGEWEPLGPSQFGESISDPANHAVQPRIAVHTSIGGGTIACVSWVQQPNARLHLRCINRPQ